MHVYSIILFLTGCFYYVGEYQFFQWFLLCGVIPIFVLAAIRKYNPGYYGYLLTVSLGYVFTFVGYIRFYRHNHFRTNTEDVLRSISYFALNHYFMMSAVLFVFMLCSVKELRNIKSILAGFCLANILYAILGYMFGVGHPQHAYGQGGFIDNPSHNGCITACLLPFLLEKKGWKSFAGLSIIATIAILMSESSIPVGTLIVVFGSYVLVTKGNLWWKLGIISTIAVSVLVLARHLDPHLFDSAYRFQAYEIFMGEWTRTAPFWYGFGPGTFQVIGPNIQQMACFMMTKPDCVAGWFWPAMHSDWLQTVFEYGAIGATMCGAIFLKALDIFYQKKDNAAFGASMALGASALFNWHLRYVLGALLLAYLIVYALKLEREPA